MPVDLPPSPLDDALGMHMVDAGPDRAVVTWGRPGDLASVGHYAIAAETTCSVGAALWWADRGRCVGMSNHSTVFDVDAAGPFTARATPLDRGMTQQLWRCEVTDGAGVTCASAEVLVANLS